MTGIILSGGKNTRIGKVKAFLKIDGIPLVERILKVVENLFDEIIVITNDFEPYLYLAKNQTFSKNIRLVRDIFHFKGPLGGIHSGLTNSNTLLNFVIACDTPFVNLQLVEYMTTMKDFDVVIPQMESGHLLPLFAVYSKNCLPFIEKQLNQGDNKIIHFFDAVRVMYIKEDMLRKFDPVLSCRFNINTEADYLEALKLIER